jgi:cyclopropane-fatty-acyl-phospholipid synthase
LPNQQHYELPAGFFERVLGPHLKYSCAWWGLGIHRLADAEDAMLALTVERADVRPGMRVLDLGCGWGSLSLWIAEKVPETKIVAVSNSKVQREFIERRCDQRHLRNVQVITADVNRFEAEGSFERIVSIELFEHLRNWERMFGKIAGWLAPGGRFFQHVFCHREAAYPYETEGHGNWMGRHFFTGGMMPSEDLVLHFQRDLVVERRWRVGGEHYRRTAEAWLENLDTARGEVKPFLAQTYGADQAKRWLGRWRLFFLACAELFGWRRGNVWYVTHTRMARREDAA